MKKKIIFTLLTLTVAVALLAGGTMSWFTDEDDAGTTEFTAGILSIDVNDAIGGEEFNIGPIDHMNPGDVYDPIELVITNDGTKNLAWFGDWTFTPVVEEGQDPAKWDKLLDVMYIKYAKMEFITTAKPSGKWLDPDEFIIDGKGQNDFYKSLEDPDLGVITLRNWNNNAGMAPGTEFEHMGALRPDTADNHFFSYKLTVVFGFHPDAGNEYQGNAIKTDGDGNFISGVAPIKVGFNVKAYQVNKDALEDAGGALLSNHFGWLKDQIAAQGGDVFMNPTKPQN